MTSVYAGLLLVECLLAQTQTFDPKAPAGVPEANGTVVERFAFRWIDLVEGSGETAKAGQQYTAHYTGWLRNETKFDSSVDRKEPFHFVQGRRQVIAGWEAGFEGMKVGGKRRLFIPYQLAYGEKGTGPIPPKSELIFDIELLGVKDVPDTPAASDLLLPFSDAESKVMQLAKALPADKYDWRPAKGVRSFAEVFVHIANGNQLLLNIAANAPARDALNRQIQDNEKKEAGKWTKDQIIQQLADSFAAVRKHLETVRAGALSQDADFFGRATTRRGILTTLDAHVAEHLGQAIAYARMNGITPPWSNGQ